MTIFKCPICQAEFRGEGPKCIRCQKEYPNANTLDEAKGIKPAAKAANEVAVGEALIKEIVEKVLIEKLLGFEILKKCEKCGQPFAPKSPSAKYCDRCKEVKVDKDTK